MDVMGWSNAAMVKRYAHVTARLRRDIADRLNTFLWAPMRLKLRLTMPDADFKRSSTRSISWSELVVRGGVEPPTFRFSGEKHLSQRWRSRVRVPSLTCDEVPWKGLERSRGVCMVGPILGHKWDQMGPPSRSRSRYVRTLEHDSDRGTVLCR